MRNCSVQWKGGVTTLSHGDSIVTLRQKAHLFGAAL